jgi:uncharacterized protein YidB (DUF937 family)
MPSRRIRNSVPNVSGGGGGTVIVPTVIWTPSDGDLFYSESAHSDTSMDITFPDLHESQSEHTEDSMLIDFPDLHESQSAFDIASFARNYDFGSNAVTQNAVSGDSDWSNISNAEQETDGTNATISGTLLGTAGGQLQLEYNDIGDYTTFGFTVVAAYLDFYTSQSGTLLGNGNLIHKYDVGGSLTTLDTFTGNVTNNPVTYDITSAITSQSTLNALSAYVEASYGAATNLVSATCDAVHFRLEVTHA